jgi:TRAP-type mannitol/chloroaromatic compound transport system substrate-binding protein
MTVSRRRVLRTATACAPFAVAGLATPAIASGTRKLRMATAWPEGMPGLHDGAVRLAHRIGVLTNGELEIELQTAGKPLGAFDLLDALAAGDIDLSHGTSYYWTSRSPGFVFFATIPFGMMAHEHFAWLRYGGGQELWDRLGHDFGVKPIGAGNSDVQTGGWFRKELLSIDDLRGMPVRFPGIGGEIMRAMGAVPELVSGAELLTAVRDGKLDGVEWVSPWVDLSVGLQEELPFCYYPGVHEPGHTIELNVALPIWESLTRSQREAFTCASVAEFALMPAQFNSENEVARQQLRLDHAVSFLRWPNDIVRSMRTLAPEIVGSFASNDPLSREIHDSYMTFLAKRLRWSEYSDRAYWQSRYI